MLKGLRSAGKGIGKDITIGNGVWIGYGALSFTRCKYWRQSNCGCRIGC
jgi:hypothetical protein